jgi:hypothetical protein
MDKFEEDEEDHAADLEDHDYSGPRRRWSDDGSD